MEIRVKSTADHYDRTTGEDVYSSRDDAMCALLAMAEKLGVEIVDGTEVPKIQKKRRKRTDVDAKMGQIAKIWGENPALSYEQVSLIVGIPADTLRHNDTIRKLRGISKEVRRSDAKSMYRDYTCDDNPQD